MLIKTPETINKHEALVSNVKLKKHKRSAI